MQPRQQVDKNNTVPLAIAFITFAAAFFVAGLVGGSTISTAIFLAEWFVGSITAALAGRAAFLAHPRMAIAALATGAPLTHRWDRAVSGLSETCQVRQVAGARHAQYGRRYGEPSRNATDQ